MKDPRHLVEYLSEFVTPDRLATFDRVLQNRTRYITLVLEDIYQPQNASAVLRTCESFGIQDVYIIENRNRYRINPDITLGSDKWLTLERYKGRKNNTLIAINDLKSMGYRIVAATPHTDETDLSEFNIEKGKAAIFLGTELTGLSGTVTDNADEFLRIPMVGFTESFNLSVTAGIILFDLISRLKQSTIPWQLTEQEVIDLKINWLTKSIKSGQQLVKRFLSQ